ncbi:MAG: undecaprenyl-diphosphate phosphatase [Smithellaceae bacterium]
MGIVQGLTELFQVSSSAHLVILQSFLPDFHQPGVALDAILHLGTAAPLFWRRHTLSKFPLGKYGSVLLVLSAPT